jgi:4-diphosphocytidyl-2-C-methyl-D-erythritol kinase
MAGQLALTGLAPAKLNLFLHVVGRREDGYHLLQTVFVLLDFGDELRVTPRSDGKICRITDLAGVREQDDLVVRAAQRLRAESGASLGADIELVKRIPMGGGLGGGSSDAASVLMLLNQIWGLGFSREKLQEIGLTLGADVPFFIFGNNAWAEGVGERLQMINVPAWWYVVLCPSATVPTPLIFGDPELTRNTIPRKIADFSVSGLVGARNDLQPVVLKQFPAVATSFAALQAVSQKSVFGARMTGSGACVFAAFESAQDAREAFQRLQPEYPGFVAQGLMNHPLRN